MKMRMRRILGGAFCAAGLLVATSASAQGFFFNYGHTPVYKAFDGDVVADLYANTFEFGTKITANTRAGVYHEQLIGAVDANIQGISVEYGARATGDLVTNLGIMMGSGSDNFNNTSLIADVYGRVALLSSENTSINAKLAYRTAPDEDFAQAVGGGGTEDSLNGLLLNIGFGIDF